MSAQENSIDVLWRGDTVIAVHKPPGLPTQAPPQGISLESRLREQLGVEDGYLAFPHRLDRPVSGIVLVALNKRAARLLSDQFAARKVKKVYVAEVEGNFPSQTDHWVDWIRKIPQTAKSELCDRNDQLAKRAETDVEVIDHLPERNSTLLRLMPLTGRMHQLRLQSASRGHRIVGDSLYADDDANADQSRQIHLQAQSLAFHDPRNGKRTVVTLTETPWR